MNYVEHQEIEKTTVCHFLVGLALDIGIPTSSKGSREKEGPNTWLRETGIRGMKVYVIFLTFSPFTQITLPRCDV
jgi:hypothetical protein